MGQIAARGKIIPTQSPRDKSVEYLRDSSPADARWDVIRAYADQIAQAMASAGLAKYSTRVSECALRLIFDLRPDLATGEIRYKLAQADFCRVRQCPVCQSRRSMRNHARFKERIPEILAAHPTVRWLMLTLTVRNCSVSDLRATIQAMNQGWGRLVKRPEFAQVKGWIRSVEVTRGSDGSAHPHYHALLMVPPAYFGRGYVKTARWVEVWRECMRLDYDPICDARAVRPKMVKGEDGQLVQSKDALTAAVAEVLKYATKSQDLLDGGPEWLAEYIRQVHALKLLTSGGALKGLFKDRKDDDLVHTGDEDETGGLGEAIDRLTYRWMRPDKRYGRKRD